MTLLSDIIQKAYRESNLIPLGATPSTNQMSEGLDSLNSLIQSTIGNEAGENLVDITVGGTYDQSFWLTTAVPKNVRLLLNLTEAVEYFLHPFPEDGQRVALVDVLGNAATYNVILNANGRTIDGATTETLNTNDFNKQWLYRADLGDWVLISILTSADSLPFPTEFDEYFVTMLALRLNPKYGQSLAPETVQALQRARNQLKARYSQTTETPSDIDPRQFATYKNRNTTNFNSWDFSTGRTFPWWM